jgi:site-specific recombinase XerD
MIDAPKSLQWNIFARELQDILASRGLSFNYLSTSPLRLHAEKVRRLQRSLTSPSHLTLLNPEELEQVMTSLQCTDLERQRMQAAVLATAIESFLLDRVDPHTARSTAYSLFARLLPVVKQASLCELPACPEYPRWNIFARELEGILAARGLRLGHLNDRGVVLHPEKVRRLQRSLTSANHLTTLNPEELDRLIALMHLSADEQKRLHAALLATAVEMVLLDRMAQPQALSLANEVFFALCDNDQDPSRVASPLHAPVPATAGANHVQAPHPPGMPRHSAGPSESGGVHAAPVQLQQRRGEQPLQAVIDAWLQQCERRTGSKSTITTYYVRLTQFRDFLQERGYDLLSPPTIISHFAPLWATTPLSPTKDLAPLSQVTVHQRLAILSSFYRFAVQGRFDTRFTANPIPIHQAATSYRQGHPPRCGLDPQQATCALQHLPCSRPEHYRDYALLWIGLTSARTPHELLALTIGDLCFDASANICSLAWPEPNLRLQLRRVPLPLPEQVSAAMLDYLCAVYHAPLATLDARLPLWVSFSTRNAGKRISAQTLADIARKHLGSSSLNAFRHAQDSGGQGSQFA